MTIQPILESFETVTCTLCGADHADTLIEGPDRNYGTVGRFRVVQCNGCGMIYTNPRPRSEVLSEYYPADYGPHNKITIQPTQPSRIERWKTRIKQGVANTFYYGRPGSALGTFALLPFALWFKLLRVVLLPSPIGPRARLLDVGCGTGSFLARLVGEWPELYGVEPDADAARKAAQIPNLNIHTGMLEEASFPDAFFDVVVMWHVLEHVPNPAAVLAEIRRILKPGGHAVIMVPNIASLEFKLFGVNWMGLDVPRHLSHFAPKTLGQMLIDVGLSVTRITIQIEPAMIEASLRNALNVKRRERGGAGWRIARIIFWGLSILLSWLHASGIMVAYARRDMELPR